MKIVENMSLDSSRSLQVLHAFDMLRECVPQSVCCYIFGQKNSQRDLQSDPCINFQRTLFYGVFLIMYCLINGSGNDHDHHVRYVFRHSVVLHSLLSSLLLACVIRP